jgi:hypothetical protein
MARYRLSALAELNIETILAATEHLWGGLFLPAVSGRLVSVVGCHKT